MVVLYGFCGIAAPGLSFPTPSAYHRWQRSVNAAFHPRQKFSKEKLLFSALHHDCTKAQILQMTGHF